MQVEQMMYCYIQCYLATQTQFIPTTPKLQPRFVKHASLLLLIGWIEHAIVYILVLSVSTIVTGPERERHCLSGTAGDGECEDEHEHW